MPEAAGGYLGMGETSLAVPEMAVHRTVAVVVRPAVAMVVPGALGVAEGGHIQMVTREEQAALAAVAVGEEARPSLTVQVWVAQAALEAVEAGQAEALLTAQ